MSNAYQRRYFMITDSLIINRLLREYDDLKDESFNKLKDLFPDLSIDGYTFITFGGRHERVNGLIVNELPPDNRYKSEPRDDKYLITPNNRSNKGKEFSKQLDEFNRCLSKTPISIANFFEKKLNADHYIRYVIKNRNYIANPVIKSIKGKIAISLPTNDNDNNFPMLPSYVTEIKHSEYIALTEE